MNEKLLSALEQVSDEHILQAATRKKAHRPYWIGTIAAILAVTILGGAFLGSLDKSSSPAATDSMDVTTDTNTSTTPSDELVQDPAPELPITDIDIYIDLPGGILNNLNLNTALSERINAGLPDHYYVDVQGLCTPILIEMKNMDVVSVQLYDFKLDWSMPQFQEEISLDIAQWQDTIVLKHMEDVCLCSWIVTPEQHYAFYPDDNVFTDIYVNPELGLRYQRYVGDYMTTLYQDNLAPITLFNSRDAFVYEEGICTVDDEQAMVTLDSETFYTISDLYDLDAIFADAKAQGMYPEFESADELFESYTKSDKDELVMAQKVTQIYISDYNGQEIIYDYQYNGNKLVGMTYSQGDHTRVENVYNGSYYRPLTTAVHNLYSGNREYYYAYTYDENGNCITIDRDTQNGLHTCREEYSYDENGRRSQGVIYWDDVKNAVVSYEYDPAGNLIKEIRDYTQAKIYYEGNSDTPTYFSQASSTFTYDQLGRVIKEVLADDNGIYNTFTYLYDEAGRKTGLYSVSNYQYDENGMLQSLMLDGNIVTFQYETVYVTAGQAREMLDILNDVLGEWDLACFVDQN